MFIPINTYDYLKNCIKKTAYGVIRKPLKRYAKN